MSPNARAAAGLPLHSGTVATDPAYAPKPDADAQGAEGSSEGVKESEKSPPKAKPKPSAPRARGSSGASDASSASPTPAAAAAGVKAPAAGVKAPLDPPPGTSRRHPKPKTPTKPSSIKDAGSATPPPNSADEASETPPAGSSSATPPSLNERRGTKKRLSISEGVEVLSRSDKAEAEGTDLKDFRKRSATPYPTKGERHGFSDDEEEQDEHEAGSSDAAAHANGSAQQGSASAAAAAIQGAGKSSSAAAADGTTPNPETPSMLQSPPPPRISNPRKTGGVAFASSPDAVREVPVTPEADGRGAVPGSMRHRKPSFEHLATPKPQAEGDKSPGSGTSSPADDGDAPAESVRAIADDSDMDVALARGHGGVPPGFTPIGAPGGHVPTPHPSAGKAMDFSGAGSTDEESGTDVLQGVPEGGALDPALHQYEGGAASPSSMGAPDLAGAPPPRNTAVVKSNGGGGGGGALVSSPRLATQEMQRLTEMAQTILDGAARRLEADQRGEAPVDGFPIVEVSVSPSGEGRMLFRDDGQNSDAPDGAVTTLTVSMSVSPRAKSGQAQLGVPQDARAIRNATTAEQISMLPPSYPPSSDTVTAELCADGEVFSRILARAVVNTQVAKDSGNKALYTAHVAYMNSLLWRYTEHQRAQREQKQEQEQQERDAQLQGPSSIRSIASSSDDGSDNPPNKVDGAPSDDSSSDEDEGRSPSEYYFEQWHDETAFTRELTVVMHDVQALQEARSNCHDPAARSGLEKRLKQRTAYMQWLGDTWKARKQGVAAIQAQATHAQGDKSPAPAPEGGQLQPPPAAGAAAQPDEVSSVVAVADSDAELPPPPPPTEPRPAHLSQGGQQSAPRGASAQGDTQRELTFHGDASGARQEDDAGRPVGSVTGKLWSTLPSESQQVRLTRRHLLQLYQLYATKDAHGLFRDPTTGQLGLSRRMWLLFLSECPRLLGWSMTASAGVSVFQRRAKETVLILPSGARALVFYILFNDFLDCVFDVAQMKFDPVALEAEVGPHPATPGGIAAIMAQAAAALGGDTAQSSGYFTNGAVHAHVRDMSERAANGSEPPPSPGMAPLAGQSFASTRPHEELYSSAPGGIPSTPLSLVGTPAGRTAAALGNSGLGGRPPVSDEVQGASMSPSAAKAAFAGRLQFTATGHIVVKPLKRGRKNNSPGASPQASVSPTGQRGGDSYSSPQHAARSPQEATFRNTIGYDPSNTAEADAGLVRASRLADGTEPVSMAGAMALQLQHAQTVLPPHPQDAQSHTMGASLVMGEDDDLDQALRRNYILDAAVEALTRPIEERLGVFKPQKGGKGGADMELSGQERLQDGGSAAIREAWGPPTARNARVLSPSSRKIAPRSLDERTQQHLQFTGVDDGSAADTSSMLSPASKRILDAMSPFARRQAARVLQGGLKAGTGTPLQAGDVLTVSAASSTVEKRGSPGKRHIGANAAPALNLRDDTERLSLLLHLYVVPLWLQSFQDEDMVELSLPPYEASG